MKFAGILIILTFALPALAEEIKCVFTGPFKTITVSEDGKTVTITTPDENIPFEAPVVETSVDDFGITSVLWGEEEDFHILEYYLDKAGGSDGMSDRVYPYTGKYWVGDTPALWGGCSTPSNPVKEPQQ